MSENSGSAWCKPCPNRVAGVAAAEIRIDLSTNDVLANSTPSPPTPAKTKGLPLPDSFLKSRGRVNDPDLETPSEQRKCGADVYLTLRGCFFAYVRSRVLPREFHNHSCDAEVDRQARAQTLCAWKGRRFRLARGISLLSRTVFATTFLVSPVRAQERATHNNEFGFGSRGNSGTAMPSAALLIVACTRSKSDTDVSSSRNT